MRSRALVGALLGLVLVAGSVPAAAQELWVAGADGIFEVGPAGTRTVFSSSNDGVADLAVGGCGGSYFAVETVGSGSRFLVNGTPRALTGCDTPTAIAQAPSGGAIAVVCDLGANSGILSFDPNTSTASMPFDLPGITILSIAIDDQTRAFTVVEEADGDRLVQVASGSPPTISDVIFATFIPETIAIAADDGSLLVGGSDGGSAEVIELDPDNLAGGSTDFPQQDSVVVDVVRDAAGSLFTIVADDMDDTRVLQNNVDYMPAAGVVAPAALELAPRTVTVNLNGIVRSVDATGVSKVRIRSGKRASVAYSFFPADQSICELSARFPGVGAKTISGQLGSGSFSEANAPTHPLGFWSGLATTRPRWTQGVRFANQRLEGTISGDNLPFDDTLEIDRIGIFLETRILSADSRVGVTLTSVDIPGLEDVTTRVKPTFSTKPMIARSGMRVPPAGTTLAEVVGKAIRLDTTVQGSVSASDSTTVEIVRAGVEVETKFPGETLFFAFEGDSDLELTDGDGDGDFDSFSAESMTPRTGNSSIGGSSPATMSFDGDLPTTDVTVSLGFGGPLVDIGLDVLGLSRQQRRCVKTVAKSAGQVVAKTQAREAERCLQNLANQRLGGDFETCVTGDLKGRVQKRIDAATRIEGKRCVAPLPSFAWGGAAATGKAAVEAGEGLVYDLFENPPDDSTFVLKSADPQAASCQKEVLKRGNRLAERIIRELNRSVAKVLMSRRSSLGVRDAAELGAYVQGELDTNSRILNEKARLKASVEKRCAGVATPFPGCLDPADPATCATESATCRSCLLLNATYDISVDCDLADDGSANASCSP